MRKSIFARMSVIGFLCFGIAGYAAEEESVFSKTAATMESVEGIELKTGSPKIVKEGPDGRKVLRFDGRSTAGITGRVDAEFAGRIDLKSKGIDPNDYDLIKVEVKADRAAVLLVSVNYPDTGNKGHWWVLDALRGPFDWKTIWIDLRMPEEMNVETRMVAGLNQTGLHLMGSVKDTGRKAQGEERRIWLGRIRFVKKVVDLDWDQTKAPYRWGKGEDLVFTYPLTVSNCLDKPLTAKLSLVPFEVKHAVAKLSEEIVKLGPQEQKVVQAEVRLPAKVAAKAAPLYCERFEARATAEGIPDSEVTILRSSDPIHLTVTVPLAEEKLQFPLLPLPKSLPADIVCFDENMAKSRLAEDPEKTIRLAMEKGINIVEGSPNSFTPAIISAAYLYHFTGDRKYLDLAAKFFAALPDIWQKHDQAWRANPVRLISSGIVVGNTLSLGWRVGGTQRPPYQYSYDGNARGGGMSSIGYAFDMIATELDPELRKKVIAGFFLPAAIQSRNHYIGDGNQQATANMTTLYGGLAARNWPLVSFTYSAEHGIHGIINWSFTDDGLHLRKGYQTYSVQSMFWTTELCYQLGIDLYNPYRERWANLAGHGFEHQYFWKFVKERRLK